MSRQIIVYNSTTDAVVTRQALDATGNFTIRRAPGNYLPQVEPAGIGVGEKKPITISANTTTTVDFDIDTGIR